MFSGGIGMMEENMTEKLTPEKEMQVIKIGGPVYRIVVGGGSASSVEVDIENQYHLIPNLKIKYILQIQGDNKTELDFGAVQRGDAEIEQKLNRFVRACTEMGEKNPILSIHDQGAGGNGKIFLHIKKFGIKL